CQNDAKVYLLLTPLKQEALGGFFLKDFLYRWYMNQCEDSIESGDISEIKLTRPLEGVAYLNEVKAAIADELNGMPFRFNTQINMFAYLFRWSHNECTSCQGET